MTNEQRYREALESTIKHLEHYGPQSPDHSCGPEGNCDGLCVDYANFSKVMDGYRKVLSATLPEAQGNAGLDKEKLLDWLESNVWHCRDTEEKAGWNDAVWKLNGMVREGKFDARRPTQAGSRERILEELLASAIEMDETLLPNPAPELVKKLMRFKKAMDSAKKALTQVPGPREERE